MTVLHPIIVELAEVVIGIRIATKTGIADVAAVLVVAIWMTNQAMLVVIAGVTLIVNAIVGVISARMFRVVTTRTASAKDTTNLAKINDETRARGRRCADEIGAIATMHPPTKVVLFPLVVTPMMVKDVSVHPLQWGDLPLPLLHHRLLPLPGPEKRPMPVAGALEESEVTVRKTGIASASVETVDETATVITVRVAVVPRIASVDDLITPRTTLGVT